MIAVLALLALVPTGTPANQLTRQEAREGFRLLFDGKCLDGFRGYKRVTLPGVWSAQDGCMMVKPSKDHGDIVTKEQFGDFELRFEWKVSKGANSGVMYRVRETQKATYFTGAEYQILDDPNHNDGKRAETSAASYYDMFPRTSNPTKPAGQWNQGKIVAKGTHFEHWLNGVMVVTYDTASQDYKDRYAKSKYVEMEEYMRYSSGHIAFQDHGNQVWFRSIRIKSLP